MKKSIRINISGYIFNIDEDAYQQLSVWLHAVGKQFEQDENADEIVADIESRVSELFSEQISNEKQAITCKDVAKVIEIMGKPEDFSMDLEDEPQQVNSEAKNSFAPKEKVQKSLFRDADERLLGGVCAGLGNYFGVNINLIRALFLIAVIFFGTGTLIYILLWVVMDEAVSTSDKLRMKGEKINISSIEKTITDEFFAVKNSLSQRSSKIDYTKYREIVSQTATVVWSITKALLNAAVFIIGVALLIYGLVFSAAITGVFFIGETGLTVFFPDFILLPIREVFNVLPLPFSATLSMLAVYFALLIPFGFLIFAGAKVAFRFKTKFKFIGIAGFSVWLVAVLFSVMSAVGLASKLSVNEVSISKVELKKINSDTLFIKLNNAIPALSEKHHINLRLSQIALTRIDKKLVMFGNPTYNIRQSKDSLTYIETKIKASAGSRKTANLSTQKVEYNWTQDNNTLSFDDYFSLKKETQFHNQLVYTTLWLPVGKTVFLSEDMTAIIWDIKNVQDEWDGTMCGKFWTMTKKGLSVKP